MKDLERVAPEIEGVWNKNFEEMELRDKEAAKNARAYSSKIKDAISASAVGLALTSHTREEAIQVVKQASKLLADPGEIEVFNDKNPYTGIPNESTHAIAREEALGLGLVSIYEKTRQQRVGAIPQVQEEISNRMKATAKTLAEIYKSPTCKFSVRNKINEIAKQEIAEEKTEKNIDTKEHRSYLAQAMNDNSDKEIAAGAKLSGVIKTVSKLRNIEKVEKSSACKVSKKLREDGLKSGISSRDSQEVDRRQNVLSGGG